MNLVLSDDNNIGHQDASQVEKLVKDGTIFYVKAISSTADIVSEHDVVNVTNQSMPPVLTHQLVNFSASDCSNYLMTNYA